MVVNIQILEGKLMKKLPVFLKKFFVKIYLDHQILTTR
jgi:hypothetical protein